MTAESFGERVRKRREQEGLSQAELADKAGISRTYLSEIERGRATNLSWKVVEGLAAALGLSIEPESRVEEHIGELPPGLEEFAKSRNLPAQDKLMLARLKFRGKQPTSPEMWALVYSAIEVATSK